jgi:hypothetical protein
MLIDCRVNEAHGTLSHIQSRGVDECHDGPKHRTAGTCSIDILELAVDSSHVVHTICRDIGESAGGLGSVILGGRIWRLVFGKVGLDG